MTPGGLLYTSGSLCTGYGGLDVAVSEVLGTRLAWNAEKEPAPSRVLAHRYPGVPNLGDITVIDWSAVEPVDVLTAGFPCQDVSVAGGRKGLRAGTRSGLWMHVARAIDDLRPPLVFLENVRGLLSAGADSDVEPCPWCLGDAGDKHALRALGAVLGDLADLGYDARWCGLRAADVGAPHGRFRVFVTAWPTADVPADAAVTGRGGARRPDPLGGHGDQANGRGGTAELGGCGGAPADPDRAGRDERTGTRGLSGGDPGSTHGGSDAPANATGERLEGAAAPGPGAGQAYATGERRHAADPSRAATDWGFYSPAISRWEAVLGRPAPAPAVRGTRGQPKLSPFFVEWMQGLDEGHVTAVPGLTENDMLKMLGNGVVPQQAAAALRYLLPRT